MKLLQVPLHDLIEAPRSQRVRDPDEAFISALADSFKSGSDQQTPIPAYLSGGKYHAIGGNHQLAAMKVAFGDDSDKPTWVRVLSFEKRDEAILEAAKDNNHRDMAMVEWQGVFVYARSLGWTQEKIARWFGCKQPFVSQAINYDAFAEHRKERINAQKPSLTVNNRSDLNPSVAPSSQDGQPAPEARLPSPAVPPNQGSMTPVPSQPGEIPTLASSSKDAPGGDSGPSKSASNPSPTGGVHAGSVAPSLLSPAVPDNGHALPQPAGRDPLNDALDSLESDAEAVLRRSLWLRALDGRGKRARLEAVYWRLGDLLMGLQYDTWNGDLPKARPKRPLPTYAEGQKVSVETHGESLILKVLEDGRFRIKDARGGIQVVSGRMILAAEART